MRLKVGVLCLCAGFWGVGPCLGTMAATAASSKTIETASTTPADTVFRIGNFDRSSFGFASGTPSRPVNYVIGRSDAKKDWYATQPAATGAGVGKGTGSVIAAPRAISFSLTGTPARAYRLHVALLSGSARIPALQVGINGKQGIFYLHPKYSQTSLAPSNIWPFAFSYEDVSFAFPESYLHEGSNRITLQVIESAESGAPEVALIYDAIELDRSEMDWNEKGVSAQIEPTIFYPQESGPPRELVDVFIRYRESVKSGSPVELSLAGQHYQQSLRGNQDFGEEKLEFLSQNFRQRRERS